MSLWMLLLVILLTAASVGYFSFGVNAQDVATRRKYYTIASVLAAALVALVVFGVVRGRWKAAAKYEYEGDDGLSGSGSMSGGVSLADDPLANNDDNDFFFGQFGSPVVAPPKPASRSLAKALRPKKLAAVGQVLDTAVLF